MMQLTHENYHSIEANKQYMSVSQYHSFCECEAKTMARLHGEYLDPDNDAFLLGSYVHAWNEGQNLGQFAQKHPEMFKKNGEMYEKFKIGEKMIATLANDPLVSKVREGEKEVIMTAELFGVPWKVMLDIYNPPIKCFADLKTTRDINMKYWDEQSRTKKNFIEFYGYDDQTAIYAEVERLNRGGDDYFSPHIIAVSKEDPPDKAVIFMGVDFIADKLLDIECRMYRIKEVWQGREEPERCEKCDYCRSTKQLKKIIHYKEL